MVLSGESQQGNVLVSYYKWFTPAAYLQNGRPIFDGYLAECFVNTNPQDPLPAPATGSSRRRSTRPSR